MARILVSHSQRFLLVAIDGVLILFWAGRPLHPYYKTLASQFQPLDDVLPEGIIPFALSPSGLIPSARFSDLNPSPALVQHLCSIIPEYIPSVPHSTPDPESDSNPNSAKVASLDGGISGQGHVGGFALPTIPMPAVHLNMDMRNLKWSWPGYLTFGKNSKDKEKQRNAKVGSDEQKYEQELEVKPDEGKERGVPSDEAVVPGSHPPMEEEKVVEVEVDTVSLADAMESQNIHRGSSNECSPGAGTPSDVPQSPATKANKPVPEEDTTPAVIRPVPVYQEETEGMSQSPVSPKTPTSGPEELQPTISEPALPPATFSQTLVHLAPGEDPLRTTKRKLYYLTVRRPLYTCFPQGLT